MPNSIYLVSLPLSWIVVIALLITFIIFGLNYVSAGDATPGEDVNPNDLTCLSQLFPVIHLL